MSPKNTSTKVVILLALALVVGVVVIGNLLLPSRMQPYNGGDGVYGATVYPTPIEGIAESCTDVYQWQNITDKNYAYIPATYLRSMNPDIPDFGNIIPAVGYLSPSPLPRSVVHFYGFNNNPGYPDYKVLRLMFDYHTVVIWYTHGLSDATVKSIKNYTETHSNVMALPWEDTQHHDRSLPLGHNVAYSTWATDQSCQNWDTTVMTDFLKLAKTHTVTHPKVARTAIPNRRGTLPEINPAVLEAVHNAQLAGK